MDPIGQYFIHNIEEVDLGDVESPLVLKPTWRNNRVGDNAISKRPYIFLIAEKINESMDNIRS